MTVLSSRVRRLPFRLEPVNGEAFWSYLERLASFVELNIFETLQITGLAGTESGSLRRSWDLVQIPHPFLESFAYVVRLNPDAIKKMQITSYIGKVISSEDYGELSELFKPQILTNRYWIRPGVSAMCPDCLKENGGAWKLEWMMPWSFACTRHKVLLAQSCPNCRKPLGPKNHYRRSTTGHLSNVPRPGFCNQIKKLQLKQSRKYRQCSCNLTNTNTVDLSSCQSLLASQVYLRKAMEGIPKTLAGRIVPSITFLQCIKYICTVLKQAAKVHDFREFPAEFESNIRREFGEADELNTLALRKISGHYFNDKALMAVLLPKAIRIASSSDPEQLVVKLVEIYNNIYKDSEKSLKKIIQFMSRAMLPDYLMLAARKMLDQKLNDRSERDGGLHYDFSEKCKVDSLNVRLPNRRLKLTPNQIEALRKQVKHNGGLSVSEQANLFEATHGVTLLEGTLYLYFNKLGIKYQKSTINGRGGWRET